MAAARAAVHVVNISPSTFNYHLFLYGGSAVGNGVITAAVHRLPKRCIRQYSSMLKKACFGRKTACFGGFSAADDTLVVNM